MGFRNREFYPVCLRQCLRQLAVESALAEFSNDIHSESLIECFFSVWQHMWLGIQKYFSSARLCIHQGGKMCEPMFAVSCCMRFTRSVYNIERAFQGRADQPVLLMGVCFRNDFCLECVSKIFINLQ